MWIFCIFVGLLIGFFTGFVIAVYAQVKMDKQAINLGAIKLCGKIYALKEIDL